MSARKIIYLGITDQLSEDKIKSEYNRFPVGIIAWLLSAALIAACFTFCT